MTGLQAWKQTSQISLYTMISITLPSPGDNFEVNGESLQKLSGGRKQEPVSKDWKEEN